MKKSTAILVIFILIVALLMSACTGGTNVSSTEPNVSSEIPSVTNKPIVNHNYPKEVEFILNREVFIFKNDFPHLYSGINDMNQIIAYVDNWDFNQILNEENFKEIDWQITSVLDDVKIVTFTGALLAKVAAKVTVEFYVQEGAKVPLAWKITTETGDSSTEVSLQTFLDKGSDEDFAFCAADAMASCLLVLMSEDATVPATKHYETKADEYMADGKYDEAILYYQKAQINGEKLSAAYYANAESYLAASDLDNAGRYFALAGNYKDAAVRVLEVYYKSAQQHEKNKDYYMAIECYARAGDYSNARAKYKECSFKQGELEIKDHLYFDATLSFECAADYPGASDRYKEACYLFAEQELLVGDIDTAKHYFTEAGNYKDAAIKMVKYHYEKGTEYFASKKYVDAAEQFGLAGNYLDSTAKEKECYYEYGKAQLSLGYTKSGISYMEKCRGFKDADEYVLSHYFKEAKTLFDTYMKTKKSFYYKKETTYETTRSALVRCEGYSNSNKLISALDIVHGLWLSADKIFDKLCEGRPAMDIYTYHMESFTSTCTDSSITLYQKGLQTAYNDNKEATIVTDYNKSYFKANVKNIFEKTPWSSSSIEIIRSIVAMFTENYDDIDLQNHIQRASWSEISGGYKTEFRYGGYNITITSSHESYGYTDLVIDARK